jgi:hypothetical protein
MEGISTIDILKKKGVKERDISMFNDRMAGGEGSNYKDLATKYGVKSPVTVSRRVKKVQKILSDLEKGVKSGEVILQRKSVTVSTPDASGGSLALPRENPFLALETFGELSGITSAGGSVIGMGAATLMQGFTREDLPYEDRQKLTMKGASVLAGGLLAAYLTYMKFAGDPVDRPMSVVSEEDGEHK